MVRSNFPSGLLYGKSSWILEKNLVQKLLSIVKKSEHKNILFALESILEPITRVCHILTVSNNQVCSNDDFYIWPVYSGERFRAL